MTQIADEFRDPTPSMAANLGRLQRALNEWLIKEEILGEARFLTINEWRARGAEFLDDALLVLIFDASTLYTMLNFGGDLEEFDDLVESFGFYYSQGHQWNLGFYPIDGYNYDRIEGSYARKLTDSRWQMKARKVKNRAGHVCQDCRRSSPLDAHHCYYASMREGYEPWEYPLSAFRALCRDCHVQRERAEIRTRAFAASLTRDQLDKLRPAFRHAAYWFDMDAVLAFLSKLGPHDDHLEAALTLLRAGARQGK